MLFRKVIFQDPPKMPYQQVLNGHVQGYFYLARLFLALQGKRRKRNLTRFSQGLREWHSPFSPFSLISLSDERNPLFLREEIWAAANGGVTNWGLKGCLAALPGNRPNSAKIALFLPFLFFCGGCQRAPGKCRKRRKKAFFLRYPRIILNPHLLNPHLRHSKRCKIVIFVRAACF